MKHLILIALSVLAFANNSLACDRIPVKRNTAVVVPFCLRALSGFAFTGGSFSAGDVKVAIDGGVEGNVGTLPLIHGTCYRLSLTAGELAGKTTRVAVIRNANFYPKCITIDTYGDATALHNIPDANTIQWGSSDILTPATAGEPMVQVNSVKAGSVGAAAFGNDTPLKLYTAQFTNTPGQITLDTSTPFQSSGVKNNVSIYIASSTGNGAGQVACIKDFNATTKVATLVTRFPVLPTGTVKYMALPTPHCNLSLYPSGH